MELVPIHYKLEDNGEFLTYPECSELLDMSVKYFANIGHYPPWIGYFVRENNRFVGSAAFKGKPKNGKVEIAYGTFAAFQKQGIGTRICRQLVLLALETNASVVITARTLPEENYSTKILKKNNFEYLGMVMDEDDGEVWEWRYINS